LKSGQNKRKTVAMKQSVVNRNLQIRNSLNLPNSKQLEQNQKQDDETTVLMKKLNFKDKEYQTF
jgi:hypothetical protein